MRRRLLVTLLMVVAVGAVGIGTVSKATMSVPKGVSPIQGQTAGFIDGAVNRELIPDQVAYALVFRLLSDRRGEEAQKRARSYLRMAFGCGNCSGPERAASEAHIDAFLGAVQEFERQVGPLDQRAEEIHAKYWPDPPLDVLAEVNGLEKQKQVFIAELIASLPARLGSDGAQKLNRHIGERVKLKTKINPPHSH